ncbi:hypothetical protein M5X11_12765 [Paenibacillus alginolyticus]|uniref:hypothetical protein n=1 Tax=Paenibacillus alginolyticus TaxID=59839 RepID=UPI0004243958|nr:hypothetical protein [Paenibacillus alginolyticus]MCY9665826.1 hypothetical protein [Paenibacillus alginolyticus]
MGEAKRKLEAYYETYMHLNNSNINATYPVSVDYTFLSDLFDLERSYASDSVIMFRRNSHPLRKFHVTETTIQMMVTISKHFNTEGTLSGCPIHKLYKLMADEYEDPCSKEQFYAEIHKFIALGILSVSQDGVVETWKLEPYKRDTGRFVLFSPLVYTKAFTDLPVAAQKLYMYIVSRNGERLGTPFKINLDKNSWVYTLTHKTRPVQIRELLESLRKLEPIAGKPLILESAVEKDTFGQWSLRCLLNPAYIVRHVEGAQYRMVPKAKIPYSKTVGRLRMLLHYNGIGEVEHIDNGTVFLGLVRLLNNSGIKTLRFAVLRIKELMQNNFGLSYNLVSALEQELKDRTYIAFTEILKETGAYRYLGVGEGEDYSDVRPLQFFRAVKDVFSVNEFKSLCVAAIPLLSDQFGKQMLPSDPYYSYRKIRPALPIPDNIFYLEDFLIELKSVMAKKTNIAS